MVRSGLDVLVTRDFEPLRGAKIALLVNQSAVDSRFKHIIEHLHGRSDLTLRRILAPEHGLWGGPQDMEEVSSAVEPLTKTEVISLYDGTEESLAPKEEHLHDIDVLVIDLPDIGSRYYTFAQTAALAMAVAGKTGTKVVVLDRPNPIDGVTIEGSPLKAKFRSFCGMIPAPQRHGLTLGELCIMYESGFGPAGDAYPACRCELEVIRVENWSRSKYLDEYNGTWVIPSPNMPRLETAIIYPGSCLFEGTLVSEARGTTQPLEIFGAPFIDGFAWREKTLQENFELQGATLRPTSFIPKFQKYSGQSCNGLQIHVTNRKTFQPFRWSLALISSLRKLYPSEFKWRTDTYEFINSIPAIDLLYGSDRFRTVVDSTGDLSSLEGEITEFERWFSSAREPYLLYPSDR